MKNGKTIAAKREKPTVDSERMRARKKTRLKLAFRWLLVLAVLAGVVYLIVRGVTMFVEGINSGEGVADEPGYELSAEVVDETDAGVTAATKKFLENMERDLSELGYKMTKAVLPVGKMRQVNLYIDGVAGYIKVRTDRGEGVQAEDIDRMLRYLGGQGFEYIDVRVERKAYWR